MNRCKVSLASRAAFLRNEGIDVPASEIPAIAKKKGWTDICDGDQLVATMRWEPSDWYLCTLKNAVVRRSHRGRGLGKILYRATAKSALAAKTRQGYNRCLVLAADVTSDNVPSIKALERTGFRSVNRFCWAPGEKPADVLHYVRMPAKNGRC